MLLVSSIDSSRDLGECTRELVVAQLREDPVFEDLGAIREQLPTTARLGRPASTGVHRGASRTGRRHTPPSRRHGADLCHPRTRPLTLS